LIIAIAAGAIRIADTAICSVAIALDVSISTLRRVVAVIAVFFAAVIVVLAIT
jgi:hypothetical protein